MVRLAAHELTELLHIDFIVITNSIEFLKAEYFMSDYRLSPTSRSLILIRIFGSLLADWHTTDFVVRVEELVRNVSSIHHKLHLRLQSFIGENLRVLCFDSKD